MGKIIKRISGKGRGKEEADEGINGNGIRKVSA